MKKFLVFFAILYGIYWYATEKFSFEETLAYAHAHQDKKWAPAAEYYVGLVYYQRAEYPKAQAAFTQLLTDFSTGTYTGPGLRRLASAAEENRDYETARQSLTRFIEEFPDDKERKAAEQKLEFIKWK